MAVTTFVDRVVLHVAAGDGGHGVRLGAPGEVQAARRPRRRQRRPRRRRHPASSTRRRTTLLDYHHSPHRDGHQRRPGAGRRTATAPTAPTSCCRCPTAPWSRAADGDGARRPGRRRRRATSSPRGGRGGLGNAALASPRRKAPGFALLGEPGEPLDVVLELQDRRRRRAGRLPQRRQVQPDRGDLRGPAEDRRLPVHHAGAQPRRGHRRRRPLHRRRRARPDPGRQRGHAASAWSSCATSSAARRWCT